MLYVESELKFGRSKLLVKRSMCGIDARLNRELEVAHVMKLQFAQGPFSTCIVMSHMLGTAVHSEVLLCFLNVP